MPSFRVIETLGHRCSKDAAELGFVLGLAEGSEPATIADARAFIAAEGHADIPDSIGNLHRDDFDLDEEGDQIWRVSVRYKRFSPTEPTAGDSSFSFETRGGTQRITHSRQTVGAYLPDSSPPGTGVPNFNQAINVTESGIEGVDVTVPVYAFSETHWLTPSQLSTAYKRTLFTLTGAINEDTFRELDPGECLFLGAAGTRDGTTSEDLWQVTYAFAGSPNFTDLSVGDISGIVKAGWDYLWVRYQEVEDEAAKMLVRKPAAAYVERVYRTGLFSQLGI